MEEVQLEEVKYVEDLPGQIVGSCDRFILLYKNGLLNLFLLVLTF